MPELSGSLYRRYYGSLKPCIFDIETTGFSPVANRIIEIGAVRVEEGSIVDRFSVFVNPQVPIPFKIEQLSGINDSMVVDAETIEEVLPKFLEFSKGAVMVCLLYTSPSPRDS